MELQRLVDFCWIWQGPLNAAGYGYVTIDGKRQYVHRKAYETAKGEIPPGKHIDHLCRNRACMNDLHLEAVDPSVNVLRGIGPSAVNSRRTHCINGHELSGDNVRFRKRGERIKRECRRCEVNRTWSYRHR